MGERAIDILRRYRGELLSVPWSDRRVLFEDAGTEFDLCEWYGGDPVAFGREVLGETYTSDVERFMRAVGTTDIVLARSATATGKTHGVGALIAWHALCKPGSQTWLCAAPPLKNLTELLWPQVERRYYGHRYLWEARGWEIRNLMLERPWGVSDGTHGSAIERPMVVGVTIPLSGTSSQRESKFSGKHAANLMFVVDEGDAVPPEVYKGIDGCMSGGHVRLAVTFNPRSQSGPVWDLERGGGAAVVHLSALRHPNVIEGRDVIPGAVTQTITVRRIMEWTEPCRWVEDDPTIFVVPPELVGVVASRSNGGMHRPLPAGARRIVNHEFAYKVLGIYSPIGTFAQVFDRAWLLDWERRLQETQPLRMIEVGDGLAGICEVYEEPEKGRRYLISADPAEGKDPEKGDYCEAIVFDMQTWAEVAHYYGRCDAHTFSGDLASLGLHYQTALLVVERNNHGAAVIEGLQFTHEYPDLYSDLDEQVGALTSVRSKAQRIEGVRGMLTQQKRGAARGMEFRSKRTIQQMLTYGRLGSGKTGGMYGAYDDAVSCVCMAHRVLEERAENRWGMSVELPEPLVLYG